VLTDVQTAWSLSFVVKFGLVGVGCCRSRVAAWLRSFNRVVLSRIRCYRGLLAAFV